MKIQVDINIADTLDEVAPCEECRSLAFYHIYLPDEEWETRLCKEHFVLAFPLIADLMRDEGE